MGLSMEFRRLTRLGFLAIASGLVGCSAFHEKLEPRLTAEVTPGAAHPEKPRATYIVEIRPEKGGPQAVEKELTDQVHVQTALEKTGAAKKFKRMAVELYRPLPNGGWHKMNLEFDPEARRVAPESDYAVLPGDRIIVIQDTKTMLDDIMERTLEPLGIKQLSRKPPRPQDRYDVRM
jgi:hypothetical protein